jgi:phage terminase large subunit GpA-like protein
MEWMGDLALNSDSLEASLPKTLTPEEREFLRSRRSRTSITGYEDLGDLVCQTADIYRPPDRLTVSQWAAATRYLNNMGAYVGPWENETAPYLVEPMDTLQSRHHDATVFVGPAQCGKTEIILNWVGHSVDVDPGDLTIYNPTQANARDFSTRRVDRLHRHTKAVGEMILAERDADNKYDKHYKSGMILGIAWPSVAELAGKPIGRIAITDRDRMEDDIDGEGDPFDLATKRTTTFGSFAMTLCESSPSREIIDHRYVIKTPHEAPPTTGILSLYNRGDRRRWYVPCPNCNARFEMRFEMLDYDKTGTSIPAQAESVVLVCPKCSFRIHPDHRYAMNKAGLWVPDQCIVDDQGRILGEPRRSKIASFWLEGCAAAFTNWQKLVHTYLTAQADFDMTLNEEPLRKFYNTDLGRPYRPKALDSDRNSEDLKARAGTFGQNDSGEIEIISAIRFLVATVDVQKNMFIVQVWGICPGDPFDIVVVDRFDIRKSNRRDEDDDALWVKPGTYDEDWHLLIDQVIKKTYPLADGSGNRMSIKLTGCDSGGKAGVTSRAYDFWRHLKTKGLHQQFQLVKGDGRSTAPRFRESFPDASDGKNKAAARGDVPIWLFNSNLLKNEANNRLDSVTPGTGMIHFPDWLPDWLYEEFCAEVFKDSGWVKLPGKRNEAWDLLYYCLGLCLTRFIRIEQLDWMRPPPWASPDPAVNPLIGRAKEAFTETQVKGYDLTEIAKKIA